MNALSPVQLDVTCNGTSLAPFDPDARLLELGAKHRAALAAFYAVDRSNEDDEPATRAYGVVSEIEDAIEALTAHTVAGLRVKAAPLVRMFGLDEGDLDFHHRTLLGVVRGLDVIEPSTAPSMDDAALLASCAAFTALEREWHAVNAANSGSLEEEQAAEPELDRIRGEQAPHLEAILALPCTTFTGVKAMVASAALWDRQLLMTGDYDISQSIMVKAVESLLAMSEPPQAPGLGLAFNVPGPDEVLIRTCTSFDALERRFREMISGCSTIEEEEARDKRDAEEHASIVDSRAQLLATIAANPPTTMAGFEAAAQSMAMADADLLTDHPRDEETDIIGRALVRGLLGLGAANGLALKAPTDPVHALADRFHAAVAAATACNSDPSDDEEASDATFAALEAVCAEIVDAPAATTLTGQQLKAAAALQEYRFSLPREGFDDDGQRMVWTVLREIAGDAYRPTSGRARA